MRIPTLIERIAAFTTGMLVLVLALEALLWLFPVNTRIRGISTDRDFPIVRAQPHQAYVYSYGWDFLNVTSGRTNNVGMFNSPDYSRGVPAIGVIGDSYIEARMLDSTQTLQGNLDRWIKPVGYRAFAASAGGAGLADYLALAATLQRELALRGLVILINEGDILNAEAPPTAGFAGLQCSEGRMSVRHVDYIKPEASALRRLAGASALMRYLDFNLKVVPWLSTKLSGEAAETGVAVHSLDQACLVDYFQEMSRHAGLVPGRIVFVMDGMRGKLDRKTESAKYLAAVQALQRFRETARSQGFEVVDMHPVFDAAERQGARVDFNPRDNHWNGLAHHLAAAEVLGILKVQGIVAGEMSVTSTSRSASPDTSGRKPSRKLSSTLTHD